MSQFELRIINEQLEEKIVERTADLERSNSELQQFAYVASHDLQEPLRMITSYTQLLSRRFKDNIDESANSYVNYIVDGTKRMQDLINAILSFSHVNANLNF